MNEGMTEDEKRAFIDSMIKDMKGKLEENRMDRHTSRGNPSYFRDVEDELHTNPVSKNNT